MILVDTRPMGIATASWQALLQEVEAMKRRIEELDCEIDRRVYELYGLTEEETRLVEEGLPR